MPPPMEELESLLQSLQALKPPGATKPKIDAITSLSINNIRAASTIVQKINTQFQNSPITHKLGVLYVVDSVTRQWVEMIRKSGQAFTHNATEGTYAFGVQRMSDTLPLMMKPLIESAPDNQKEKIVKLVDIWEKSQTFPLQMLTSFREQLKTPKTVPPPYKPPGETSTNNPGSAAPIPAQAAPSNGQAAAPRPDVNAALAALVNVLNPAAPQPIYPAQPQYGTNGHAPGPGSHYAPPVNSSAAPVFQTALGMPVPSDLMTQLFQAVTQGTIRPEQATQIIEMVQNSATAAPAQPSIPTRTEEAYQNGQGNGHQQEHSGNQAHDPRPGGQNAPNVQQGLYRDRSQSPPRRRVSPSHRRGSPPQRRDSPTYGVYDPSSISQANNGGRQQHSDRGRGRGKRQRTPPGQRRQQSPTVKGPSRGPQAKFVEYDDSLPRDCIRVLSRTLFVGGATGTERELRDIFGMFGKVQTCIVNHDKRHAFVKMVNRHDSLAAREGMERSEKSHDPSISAKARQTRWGVGFGPRDCADYHTGISIIPINRLTEADHKWAMTAEYGGTGGIPVAPGMVFEEPDIEIGAGVSSKAISRRIVPETTGTRRGGFGVVNVTPRAAEPPNPPPRYRKPDRPEPRRASPRLEAITGVPPPVPGFGFQIPGMRSNY
ncbi:uncharacterized protein BDZ99DRAFT_561015 [Mytilinidion resinicola]|uniref:RNA binding protein Nrd1 n=1 Tax=Mytilinidion resinicola TaxID=574789 RepID=A0A6A6YQ91_9PEZI|nr:uncharacterized protein BDZ99DRAFT_561015 [Mytilinidion resinicola]KAF2810693.1 hypothetical protein BDZ99DRAFT_561015 [Mytilinidion resinicola]